MVKKDTTEKPNLLKQNTRDIIFREGFASDQNLPKIYHSLYPKDENWLEHEYIRIYTNTILENGLTNDLSFVVRRKKAYDRLICLEAQTTWETKDLTRFAKYALISNIQAYNELQDYDFFKSQVSIYIFFVGKKGNPKSTYNYTEVDEAINSSIKYEFFFRSISKKNKNIPSTRVFKEYVEFCDLYVEITNKYGRTRKAAEILVEKCIELGIYPEIFGDKKRREQFVSDYFTMFSNQAIFEAKEREIDALKNENEVQREEFTEKIDTLVTENKAQKEEINTLENKNKVQKEEINTLENKNKVQKEEINTLENEKQKLIDRLRKFGIDPNDDDDGDNGNEE